MTWDEAEEQRRLIERMDLADEATVACPRCHKTGPDAFGPQLESGWHEGCAADVAHEQDRDRDRLAGA